MANQIKTLAKLGTGQKSKELAATGIIATGSHLGTQLIHKVAARPLIVLSLGIIAGIVLHKNLQQSKTEECCGEQQENE